MSPEPLAVDLVGEADRAHESAIESIRDLLVATKDRRYFDIMRRLIAMRSEAQVRRMEAEQGLRGITLSGGG